MVSSRFSSAGSARTPSSTPSNAGRWKPGAAPSFTSRSTAIRSPERDLLEPRLHVHPPALELDPAALGIQRPGQGVVGQRQLEPLFDLAAQRWILDGHDRLYAAVEVAFHQVGRTHEVLRVRPGAEPDDAGMFEEAADERATHE